MVIIPTTNAHGFHDFKIYLPHSFKKHSLGTYMIDYHYQNH